MISDALATIHQVGPGQVYSTPNALYLSGTLADGDTIEIAAGFYSGTAALAHWSNHSLLIRGVGGKADMIAAGEALNGKSIWITSGNNITIESIGFFGCSVPDHNGAGIRSEGVGLTVRHSLFKDNENGILTNSPGSGLILIEHCEFDHNGFGDGYSHNVYINHVEKLIFRFNYSHHAKVGHNLKSRAQENIIYCNRIMDEETGNSSRLIDLPNGGFSLVAGNLLMQGPNAENNNMVGYGLEGLTNSDCAFYFSSNTLVNKREASCRFLQIASGTPVAEVVNNIFAGSGILIDGMATRFEGNVDDPVIENFHFINEPDYDYRLNNPSPAIDTGLWLGMVNGWPLIPESVYLHPADSAPRSFTGNPDAGAYEFSWPSGSNISQSEIIQLNFISTRSVLMINTNSKQVMSAFSCNMDGRIRYLAPLEEGSFSTQGHPAGLYLVIIQSSCKTFSRKVYIH